MVEYNYQFQQNNRIIYPLVIVIKEYKTFLLIEEFQGEYLSVRFKAVLSRLINKLF